MICSCGSNIRAHKRGCPLNPSHKGKEELAKPNPVAAPDVQIIGRDETPVIVSGPIPTQEWRVGAVATIKSWSKCKVSVELKPSLTSHVLKLHHINGIVCLVMGTVSLGFYPKKSLGLRKITKLFG